MEQLNATPRNGQSVFIPFRTGEVDETGKVGYVKGGSLMPFDTIEAVYLESETTKSGKKAFNVRVKSGDVVTVVQKDDKWQAIK